MASIFTKIINKEIPANIVAENDHYIAFLDIFPLVKGHTLVIPKTEVDYIFDIEEEYFRGLWSFAKMVSKGVEKAVECKRVGIAVIGLEVPHAHIHLVPLNNVGDINFEKPKLKLSGEELAEIAERIRKGLAA
jgi:histidine triad (HIT) family protein